MSKASRKRAKAKWQQARRDRDAEYPVKFGRVPGSQPMYGAGVTCRAQLAERKEVPLFEHRRKAKPDHKATTSLRVAAGEPGRFRKVWKVRSLRTVPSECDNMRQWYEHYQNGSLPKHKERGEFTWDDIEAGRK